MGPSSEKKLKLGRRKGLVKRFLWSQVFISPMKNWEQKIKWMNEVTYKILFFLHEILEVSVCLAVPWPWVMICTPWRRAVRGSELQKQWTDINTKPVLWIKSQTVWSTSWGKEVSERDEIWSEGGTNALWLSFCRQGWHLLRAHCSDKGGFLKMSNLLSSFLEREREKKKKPKLKK